MIPASTYFVAHRCLNQAEPDSSPALCRKCARKSARRVITLADGSLYRDGHTVVPPGPTA